MKKIMYVRTTGIYNDSRATKEIKTLLKAGYYIDVYGWDKNGNAAEECCNIFGVNTNIKFNFYKSPSQKKIGLKKIFQTFGWLKWIKRKMKSCKEIDILHACDFDGAIGVYKCKKNIKFVYDIYDYYVDAHKLSKFIAKIIEKFEIKMINKSDLTIICNEERREQIKKASPKKTIVIHNSPDLNEIPKNEIEFDYVYCGALIPQRLIEEILEEYSNNTDLIFAFAGFGKFDSKAKELADKYENFHYYGSISYDEVIELESKSKVMSAIYEPAKRNHRLCAPNKFYESLALGKPLIVCKGTGIDRIVENNCIGKSIRYNALDFYIALRELLNMELDNNKGRNLYLTKYKWEIMQEILLNSYEDLYR